MNDMINRQKLIEELEWQIAHWQESVDEFHDKEEIGVVKGLKLALEKINSQPPADQWIPCSEPPKEDGMYFITAKVLDKLEVQYVFYQKNLDLFICNGKPIAWKPLPEPYKGVE